METLPQGGRLLGWPCGRVGGAGPRKGPGRVRVEERALGLASPLHGGDEKALGL